MHLKTSTPGRWWLTALSVRETMWTGISLSPSVLYVRTVVFLQKTSSTPGVCTWSTLHPSLSQMVHQRQIHVSFQHEYFLTALWLLCFFSVPFCYTADLSAPSAIMEIPATSPYTPEMPTQHPLIVNVSQRTLTVYASAHPLLMEYGSETKDDEQNHDQNDIRTPSNTDTNIINKGWTVGLLD